MTGCLIIFGLGYSNKVRNRFNSYGNLNIPQTPMMLQNQIILLVT